MALLVTLVACLAYPWASRLGAVRALEGQLLDLRFQLRPFEPPSDAIVVVLIDDASIREVGRWPWSRGVMAKMVRRLAQAGARTIALDLLLVDPEPRDVPATSLEALREALRAQDRAGAPASAVGIDERLATLLEQADGDQRLARTLEDAGNVIVPFSFGSGTGNAAAPRALPPAITAAAFRIVQSGPNGYRPPPPETSLLAPIPELARAAAGLGHGDIPLEQDGAARFERPAIALGDHYFPSFALEAARRYLGVGRDRVRLQLGQGIWLDDRFVPTDQSMRLPVNYRHPERFTTVPAAHLLSDATDSATFAGKLVLVGGRASGFGDTFVSPFTSVLPGVERHATVIDNILEQDFLIRPQAGALFGLATILVGGLVIGGLASALGLIGTTLGFLAIAAAVIAANLWAFLGFGLWLDLLAPLLGLAIVYSVVLAYRYFIGERKERAVRAAFKHYLSPDLVERVARDPSLLRLGGEQRELTVLFADIRQSTRLAEALGPDAFALLLNDAFAVVTRGLFRHEGMLDRFTGDGVVAIFGAPVPQPDHALRACRAALAMQDEMKLVQERWARPDLPRLEIGVGINTGRMIIGNMGSKERFSYTVIGDEANLGARLEGANKDFRTRILISEATWQKVKDEIAAREIDVVTFRGLERPVRVFEALGLTPLPPAEAERARVFAAGLAAYRRADFSHARELFEAALSLAPDDRPVQIYLERCRERLSARTAADSGSE